MNVYFLSGLGADERAFSFLQLDFCNPVFIPWIKPQDEEETLPSYAGRISELIKEPAPVIVGLSFGGMLATEIASVNPSAKAILISSAKHHKEIPFYLRMWRKFPLYRFVPSKFAKAVSKPLCRLFMNASSRKEMHVLNNLLNDADVDFNLWAVDAVLNWKNNIVPPNVTHIHGTGDKLLPYSYVKADYTIEGGTHLMIMNNAKEISGLLKSLIHKS